MKLSTPLKNRDPFGHILHEEGKINKPWTTKLHFQSLLL